MVYQTRTTQAQRVWAAIAAGVLAAALAFAFGLAAPAQAHAAQDNGSLKVGAISTQAAPKFYTGQELYAGDHASDMWRFVENWNYDAQVTKVASNNVKVIKVKKLDSFKDLSSYEVYPLKAGKAKISITYKLKGKTKTIKGTVTVKTCPAAFKSMKLNGKVLTIPTPKKGYTSNNLYGFTGTAATFELKLAEGWEADYLNGYFYKSDGGGKDKDFAITSGKKFTIPKKYQGSINLTVHDANWEHYFYYTLYIYRTKPITLAKATYYIGHPKTTMPIYDVINQDGLKAQVVSVKSSKPSVLKITKGSKFEKIKVQAKKAGTAKLTVKYKVDGRTYSSTATCKAAKFPLKSVTLNGKSLNTTKSGYGYYDPKFNKSTVKVKFTPISGWKVSSIKYYAKGKTKSIKNGASVTKPKNTMVRVLANFKKGKQSFAYWIDLG